MYDSKLVEKRKYIILSLLNKCARKIATLDLSGKYIFLSKKLIQESITAEEMNNVVPQTWEFFQDAVEAFKKDTSPKKNSEEEKEFIFFTNVWIRDLLGVLECTPFIPISDDDMHRIRKHYSSPQRNLATSQ